MIVAASADKELLLQFPGSVKNHAGDLRFTEAIVPLFFFIFSEEVISAFLLDAVGKRTYLDRIQLCIKYDIPFCITLDDPGVISCLDLIHAGNVVGVISLCEDEAAILCRRERRRAVCIIFSFSGILRQNLSIEIHHRDRKCIGIFPFGIFFQFQKSVRKSLHMAESVFRDDPFEFRGHRSYLSDRLRRACIFRFYRYSGGIRLSSARRQPDSRSHYHRRHKSTGHTGSIVLSTLRFLFRTHKRSSDQSSFSIMKSSQMNPSPISVFFSSTIRNPRRRYTRSGI